MALIALVIIAPSAIALIIEAASTSETLVNYQTAWCYNPEDSHLHMHMLSSM
jgi:hypothetical protein